MFTALTQHLDQHIRTAVNHLGLLAKVGLGVDHAQQFDDCFDMIE